jgi:hypothetical protein
MGAAAEVWATHCVWHPLPRFVSCHASFFVWPCVACMACLLVWVCGVCASSRRWPHGCAFGALLSRVCRPAAPRPSPVCPCCCVVLCVAVWLCGCVTVWRARCAQALDKVVGLSASRFCRRRLPVVMTRLRMCENLKEAVTFIEQGHVRVGPEVVTDPAFIVTRALQDFVTWVDSSKIKRTVLTYQDAVDDFELQGN